MANLASLKSRLLKRLAKDDRGVAAVEFGLIAVPLCVLLLGGMDIAYQAYVRSILQGALNEVSRAASVEAPTMACGTGTLETRVECMIKQRVNTVARNATYDVKIRNYYEFSSVGKSEKLTTDGGTIGVYDDGDCFEDVNKNGIFDNNVGSGATGVGGADDIVFYEVTLSMPRIIGVTSFLSGGPKYNIVARAAVRNQPYAVQATPPIVCPD